MKRLFETNFFSLIRDFPLSDFDASSLKDAYDEFVNTVFTERSNTSCMDVFYNSLCYVQVELKSLRKQPINLVEKKYPYTTFRKSHLAC